MKIKCVSPEEAESFVGSRVSKKITKRPYHHFGTAVSFSQESCMWDIKYDDGSIAKLTYPKLGKDKQRYEEWQQLEKNN